MALEEAIEQVRVMARVHRRLRANSQDVSLDSRAFIDELCGDLKAVARARPISIECKADSRPLCMDEAVSLGLIVNELVTNAIKHAFPLIVEAAAFVLALRRSIITNCALPCRTMGWALVTRGPKPKVAAKATSF